MSYSNKIRTLEESHRLVTTQIETIQQSANPDQEKLKTLVEARDKYLNELRVFRRAQYEESQSVNYDDDR
jgi:hypothetical protein